MLLANKFLLSLAIAFAFSRAGRVYAQDDPDSDTEADAATSSTRTSTSAGVTGTTNVDPCLLQCAQQAASNAGCDLLVFGGISFIVVPLISPYSTDPSCICSSETFQSDTTACLQSQCSASVVSQAQALGTQECTAGGAFASTTETGTSRHLASTGASTRTSSVASILHSATSSGSASAAIASGSATNLATAGSELTITMNGILGLVSVIAGIVFGALSV